MPKRWVVAVVVLVVLAVGALLLWSSHSYDRAKREEARMHYLESQQVLTTTEKLELDELRRRVGAWRADHPD